MSQLLSNEPAAIDFKSIEIDSTPLIRLLRDGFVVLPGILNMNECQTIDTEMKKLVSNQEIGSQSSMTRQQSWHWPQSEEKQHVAIIRSHLQFLEEILGSDMRHLRSWIRLSPPQGHGTAWHKDHDSLFVPMPLIVGVTTASLTEENGGTRFLKGTQHLPHPVHDFRAYPQEEVAIGSAGSLIVFQAGVWHRGGDNQTNIDRWMLFAEFGAAQMGQASILPTDFQLQTTEYQAVASFKA
jgi:ectoine hydroxylase-related dioxygenase (phytanoyl-CoA dioxygenase family)